MARDFGAFDLFGSLTALSKKDSLGLSNTTWFETLTPAGQKAAAPFVMMRWLSGTSDPAQIVRLNTVANKYIFAGSAEKSALMKLLAIGTTGRASRYNWIKGPSTAAKRYSLEVLKEYYECSTREAATYKVSSGDLIRMAEELGWPNEDLAALKKEQSDGSGEAATTGRKSKKPAGGKRRSV